MVLEKILCCCAFCKTKTIYRFIGVQKTSDKRKYDLYNCEICGDTIAVERQEEIPYHKRVPSERYLCCEGER